MRDSDSMLLQGDAGGKSRFAFEQGGGVAVMYDASRQHLCANVFQCLLIGTEMNAGTNKQLTHISS